MNIDEVLPKVLPAGWHQISAEATQMVSARAWQYKGGIRVVCSLEKYPDAGFWLHVSLSYPDKIPNWADIRTIKDLFIGRKSLAVQIFPHEDDYVNFHPNTLHLFTRVDGDTLPGLAPRGRTLT